MSTTFTSPFTGTVVVPTDVSYYDLNFGTDTELYWPAVVNPTQVPAARIIDCTPTTFGLTIFLPQGNQGSVGSDILIRNFGANSFIVANFSGGSSVTVDPGVAIYFYLSDNTTVNGVWQNVTFGAGTSSADAATLQGAGLTTIAGKLAVTSNISRVSTVPTISDASRATSFIWEGGNNTFNLPSPIGLSTGWWIAFRNNGTGALTIQPQGISLINGENNIIANPGDSGYVMYEQSTGNFFTIGYTIPSNVTFTAATYDVDSIVGSTLSLVSYAPIIQTYVALSGSRSSTLNVVLPAITQMYVLVNKVPVGTYSTITFQISGSGGPSFSLAGNTVATVISDGNTIFSLTSAAVDSFYAINGTASSPPFSFLSDTNTGMYLVGANVLGLTANGSQILRLDNSNLADPQVSTPATFTAGLISGGAF
jgi:hypothetical protein